MRGRILVAIALLAFAYSLWPSGRAVAGFGAIAWDKESGKSGWVWNQPTAQKAATTALDKCGATGCKVIIHTDSKRCSAIATTADGMTAGAAARDTKQEAQDRALAGCQKRKAGECTVRASDCNK